MNINALQTIWSLLKSEYDVSFLLTSRLNQDSLENLFSIIRGRGGHRDNPDAVHFQSAFKQVIIQNMFVPSPTANCRNDGEGDCVLSVDDFLVGSPLVITAQKSNAVCVSNACQVPLLAAEDAFVAMENKQSATFDTAVQNTLMYITGYVCRKVLEKHNCQHCKCTMLRSNTDLIGQSDLFCAHKAYNVHRGNFGGLKAPSQFMFDLMTSCEEVFISVFDAVKHKQGVRVTLNKAVECYLSDGSEKPCIISQRHAAYLYLRTRLHYKFKFLNRDISTQSKNAKRKNRKAMKVMHK